MVQPCWRKCVTRDGLWVWKAPPISHVFSASIHACGKGCKLSASCCCPQACCLLPCFSVMTDSALWSCKATETQAALATVFGHPNRKVTCRYFLLYDSRWATLSHFLHHVLSPIFFKQCIHVGLDTSSILPNTKLKKLSWDGGKSNLRL